MITIILEYVHTGKIEISRICLNEGQIEGLPKNSRFIKSEKFEQLCRSIQELPEMTEVRDILVYPHNDNYVVIGGNMRLLAYQELCWKEVPCCILPESMPVDKLQEMVIQDNNPFGEMDWVSIASDWDIDELKDWGVDVLKEWDVSPDECDDSFSLPSGEKQSFQQITFTLADEQASLINGAIQGIRSCKMSDDDTFGNVNANGNALYLIVKQWEELKK